LEGEGEKKKEGGGGGQGEAKLSRRQCEKVSSCDPASHLCSDVRLSKRVGKEEGGKAAKVKKKARRGKRRKTGDTERPPSMPIIIVAVSRRG